MSSSEDHKKSKFIEFFRMLVRIFYNEFDIPVMDFIVKAYFEHQMQVHNNQRFETKEVSDATKLPDKYVRMSLYNFRDAKLISSIESHQFNGNRAYLKEYVDENYEIEEKLEFWELNKDVKDVVKERIEIIEKKMEDDFKVTSLFIYRNSISTPRNAKIHSVTKSSGQKSISWI